MIISKIKGVYSDTIFKEAANLIEVQIKLNGELINTMSYADDIVIHADYIESLQLYLDKLTTVAEKMNLNINTND